MSVKPADPKAAFTVISDMENETGAIRDLGHALIMAAAGASELNSTDAASALTRLGWLLVEQVEALEAKRAEAFHLTRALVNPVKAAA